MCIIYAGTGVPEAAIVGDLDEAAAWNPDGVGMAVLSPHGHPRRYRSRRSSDWLSVLEKAAAKMGDAAPWILHFRLATSGHTGASNVHPFRAGNGGVLMAHNGILPVSVQHRLGRRPTESDTAALARYLRGLGQWDAPTHLTPHLGRGRIALLRPYTSEPELHGGGWRWHADINAWTSTARPHESRLCSSSPSPRRGRGWHYPYDPAFDDDEDADDRLSDEEEDQLWASRGWDTR